MRGSISVLADNCLFTDATGEAEVEIEGQLYEGWRWAGDGSGGLVGTGLVQRRAFRLVVWSGGRRVGKVAELSEAC